MRIHLRLAELARLQRGWSLRRLSEELDVDYQNVINWNTGRAMPHLQTFIQIARLLRCTLDQLVAPDSSTSSTAFPFPTRVTQNTSYSAQSIPPSVFPKRGRPPKAPQNSSFYSSAQFPTHVLDPSFFSNPSDSAPP